MDDGKTFPRFADSLSMQPIPNEELKPAADDLLFFVDETGHETFAGNQRYYGLGCESAPEWDPSDF